MNEKKMEKFIPDRVHNNKQKNQHVPPTALTKNAIFQLYVCENLKNGRVREEARGERERENTFMNYTL
jgi:hypothetical protein